MMANKSSRFSSRGERVNFRLYCVLVSLLLIVAAILFLYGYLPGKGENVLRTVLEKASLTLPFVWLASHVNAVINRRKKLYVEYEHKRIVMEFYVAFRDQIEKDDKTKEAFAKAVMDVVLRFPSIIGEAQESDSPMDKILRVLKENDKKKTIEKTLENE